MRPSRSPSLGSRLFTLYDARKEPLVSRMPVSTVGAYVYACWYEKPGTYDGGGSGTVNTDPRSCHGPTGFFDHHACTSGPMMLNGLVTSR